jgi:hypothetical protein
MKQKSTIKRIPKKRPTKVQEAHTIGYVEGFADGRRETLESLDELKLLKRGWKTAFNKLNNDKGVVFK